MASLLDEELPPQRLNRLIQDYFSAFLEIVRVTADERALLDRLPG